MRSNAKTSSRRSPAATSCRPRWTGRRTARATGRRAGRAEPATRSPSSPAPHFPRRRHVAERERLRRASRPGTRPRRGDPGQRRQPWGLSLKRFEMTFLGRVSGKGLQSPVPLSATWCGWPGASSSTSTPAVFVPGLVGAKWTLKVQRAPGAIGPVVQVLSRSVNWSASVPLRVRAPMVGGRCRCCGRRGGRGSPGSHGGVGEGDGVAEVEAGLDEAGPGQLNGVRAVERVIGHADLGGLVTGGGGGEADGEATRRADGHGGAGAAVGADGELVWIGAGDGDRGDVQWIGGPGVVDGDHAAVARRAAGQVGPEVDAGAHRGLADGRDAGAGQVDVVGAAGRVVSDLGVGELRAGLPGRKRASNEHRRPGATGPLRQVRSLSPNWLGSAPPRARPETWSGALPVLRTMTKRRPLTPPAWVSGNPTAEVTSTRGSETPVPVSATVWGLPGASSSMRRRAVMSPVVVGAKCAVTRQAAPTSTVAPVHVSPESENWPGLAPMSETPDTCSGAVPALRTAITPPLVVVRPTRRGPTTLLRALTSG